MARNVDVHSEVTGAVWKVMATKGQRVERDQVLLVVESMKMEIPIESPCAGTLQSLYYAEGEAIAEGAVLVTIAAD